ncbi:MAG TPA: hypothetical protein V6C65_25915, partial [Allocoleopsis sp.]
GINTTAPTATLDVDGAASVSGSLSFRDGAGSIQTTANNTLTIGGNTTGNIVLTSAGVEALRAQGSGLTAAGTVTINGLLTANAGATIPGGQNLTLSGFAQGSILYTNGSAVVTGGVTGTATQVLHGGNTPYFAAVDLTADVSGILPISSGGSPFEESDGAIFERIGTQDFLLGSNATSSAKFAFTNVNGGVPTLTIADNSGSNSVFLTGTGNLATSNNQALTLGGSTTGNIFISPAGENKIGIGFNTTPLAALDVRNNFGTLPSASIAGATSFAGLVVDNSGIGDIFTASASGTSRFAITNSGTIRFNAGSDTTHTLTSDATSALTLNIPELSQTSVDFCFSSGNCAGAGSGITGNGAV